jgi:hypothetical protein
MKKSFIKEAGFNILFWVIACNVFVVYRYFGIEDFYIPKTTRNITITFFESCVIAFVYGTLLSLVDLLMDNEKFKRKSFRHIMLMKSSAYSIVILFSLSNFHTSWVSNQ